MPAGTTSSSTCPQLRALLVGLAAVVAVVAGLMLLAGSARAAQVATTWRGAQVHSLWASETTQQMHQDLDAARQAGANVVRVDIAWATLDSTGPGQLTAWYSQRLSQFMAYAAQLNLKVIAIAFTTPCWASSAPDSLKQGCQGDWWGRGVGWYPPTNDAQFGDFVRYLTSTYANNLAAIEIWNEPDESNYFVSAHPGDDYAQLLKAAYPAAKAGSSAVPVLAGALSGADLSFVQTLYQDGAQGYFDGLSLHSYCDGSPYATGASDPRYEFQSGLEAMHDLEAEQGDQAPLWVTEFGWSTLDVSPADQATWTQQGYEIMAGMPYVQAGIAYELHDDIGGDPTDRESHFGMMNQDYSAKPAYAAFSAVMSAPASPALASPADGGAVNGARPTLSFTAAPDSTVAVSIDGAAAGPATADPSGNASFTPDRPLSDGSHSLSAVDTDAYGNVGPSSGTAHFTVEPAVPALTSPQAGASTGTQPTFSFTADAGTKVAVYLDGALLGTTTADGAGVASVAAPVALAYGPHSVDAVASDSIGYASPASAATSFVVAVPSPVLLGPQNGTSSGTSPVFSFRAPAGLKVAIYVDRSLLTSATADGAGSASATAPRALGYGLHSVYAVASDALGHVSSASSSSTFDVAPPAPTLISPRQGSTSDAATVSVQVKGIAGDVATICVTGKPCSSGTVNLQGLATVAFADLSAGKHAVQATQRDGTGVAGPTSSSVSWTVSGSGPGSGKSGAGSSSASGAGTATATAAGAGQRLSLRLAKLRSSVLPVICQVRTGSITRCQVTLYLGRRKIGSGTILLLKGRASLTVRVRLNRLGTRRLRASRHGLAVTAKASAAASGRHTLAGLQRARLGSPRQR